MAVETTLTPGAVTSGLRCESRLRGPPDEKLAKAWKDGLGMPVAVESVPEAADERLTRSVLSTPRKGIVTPPMPPSNGGQPPPLFTTPTPLAPSFSPQSP